MCVFTTNELPCISKTWRVDCTKWDIYRQNWPYLVSKAVHANWGLPGHFQDRTNFWTLEIWLLAAFTVLSCDFSFATDVNYCIFVRIARISASKGNQPRGWLALDGAGTKQNAAKSPQKTMLSRIGEALKKGGGGDKTIFWTFETRPRTRREGG